MRTTPSSVNDMAAREEFFRRILPEGIDRLTEEMKPLWGKMSAQQMVEHLIWAFEASRGAIVFMTVIPEGGRERIKAFLNSDMPTPREFGNPVLGDEPPPLRYSNLDEAKKMLREEIDRFFAYFQAHPEAIHTHSVFGPLNSEEWERSHYKHCRHHLLQFGLIKNEVEEEDEHT